MHIGIFGTSKCGKSTLAFYLINRVYRPAGRPSLVLDPVGCDPAFLRAGADFLTDDTDEFIRVVNANQDCSLFVDEAGDKKQDYRIRRLASQYRHGGFNVHYMGHRYKDVQPAVRTCLDAVFLFRSCAEDCKDIANDFICEDLLQGVRLQKGEYIYHAKFGKTERGNISPFFGKF